MAYNRNGNGLIEVWCGKAKWLLPIIGTVMLVGLLYRRLDFHRITNLRQSVDWGALLIAASLTLPFVMFKTLKWHRMLKTNQPQSTYTLRWGSQTGQRDATAGDQTENADLNMKLRLTA